MYYGIARLELLVSHSRSLKEKRAVTNRLRDRLQRRFRIAVTEVDYLDLWQRGAFGLAVVAFSLEAARNALQAVRREVESDPRLVVTRFEVIVDRFDGGEPLDGGIGAAGNAGVAEPDDEWFGPQGHDPAGGDA